MPSLLADIAVRVTSEPDHGRDLVDALTLIFAGFAAFGTVGAVIVALFGAGWHERRTKPKLSITADGGSLWLAPGTPDDLSFVAVDVANAPGRRQADDVEVLATVVAPLTSQSGKGAGLTVVEQEQLVYASYPSQDVTAAIPPAFSRRVALCAAGYRHGFDQRYRFTYNPRPADDELQIVVAASSQLRSGRYPTLAAGGVISTFYVLFEVVARGVDTSRFIGRFEVKRDASGVPIFVWLEPPVAADPSICDHDTFATWLDEHGKASARMTLDVAADGLHEPTESA